MLESKRVAKNNFFTIFSKSNQMKYFRIHYLIPALLIMLLATCKNTDSPTGIDANGNTVTTIAGMINDENGQPIEGVSVNANGKTAITNEYGTFMIQNAAVPSSRCFIICKKNGYFTGSRAETPKGGGITELRLTMQSNNASYTLDATSGGKISVGSASVSFPAASLVDANGKPFTGTAKVSAKFLYPTQSSFYNSFSGDFAGKRLDGSQTELLSYGVLRVQITDGTGNELNLAEGKTATLTYPLASSMLKDAPASMPLWYFDEKLGMWMEEGSAVKSGDYYSGEVSHFTDWNLDIPTKIGMVKGRVMCKSEGLARIYVTVGERKTLTDTNGYFNCRVPLDIALEVTINSTTNSNLTAPTTNVAPLTIVGEERTINIEVTDCPSFIIGKIVDCDGKPTSGLVVILYPNGFQYQCTTSGFFKICVPASTSLYISSIAYTGKIYPPTLVEALHAGEIKDLDWIISCNEKDVSIKFKDIDLGNNVIDGMVLSPSGSKIAVCGYRYSDSRGFTEIYDTKTGSKLCSFSHNRKLADIINFSDDETKFLIQWGIDSAYVINPNDGAVIQKFFNIMNARLLPDGLAIHGAIPLKGEPTKNTFYSVKDGSKIKEFSFKMTGKWEMLGINSSNKLVLIEKDDSELVLWDIETDKVSNVLHFPAGYTYGEISSPRRRLSYDFSTLSIAVNDSSGNFLEFFDTQTSIKLNSNPFKPKDKIGYENSRVFFTDRCISNDNTLMVQKSAADEHYNLEPLQPEIYTFPDMKFLRVLPLPIRTTISFSTYNSNSKFIASVIDNNSYPSSDKLVKVRIWEVK